MAKITVTHAATNKTKFKDLDDGQVLSEIRKQLGDFMNAADLFIDSGGEPVDVTDIEENMPLKAIFSTGSGFKMSGKATSGGDPKPTDPKPTIPSLPIPSLPIPSLPIPSLPIPSPRIPSPRIPEPNDPKPTNPKADTPGTKDPNNSKPFTGDSLSHWSFQKRFGPRIARDCKLAFLRAVNRSRTTRLY